MSHTVQKSEIIVGNVNGEAIGERSVCLNVPLNLWEGRGGSYEQDRDGGEGIRSGWPAAQSYRYLV